jgi:hypothetical protein
MRVLLFALPLLVLAACNEPAVSESNQSVIDERARSLERATDSAVDQSIVQMARETTDEANESPVDDASR